VARIRLRVSPGARSTELVGRHGEAWKVRVDAPPERGRANERVCRLLAQLAGVHRSAVEVVSGATGRDKLIAIHGIDQLQLERMLDDASGN
jgi:uncharacterized protein (TIGR00251 family)